MKNQNPFKFPDPDPSLSLDQLIERNLDYYHDNMRRVAAEYGGQLVTNKGLAGWLMKVVNAYYKKHGEYPDRLTPPQYPLEEFVPLQIEFKVRALGVPLIGHKWYFVRRARRVAIGSFNKPIS